MIANFTNVLTFLSIYHSRRNWCKFFSLKNNFLTTVQCSVVKRRKKKQEVTFNLYYCCSFFMERIVCRTTLHLYLCSSLKRLKGLSCLLCMPISLVLYLEFDQNWPRKLNLVLYFARPFSKRTPPTEIKLVLGEMTLLLIVAWNSWTLHVVLNSLYKEVSARLCVCACFIY